MFSTPADILASRASAYKGWRIHAKCGQCQHYLVPPELPTDSDCGVVGLRQGKTEAISAKAMRGEMSKRIDKSCLVFASIENAEHNRCVDLFSRPDGSYGFEEFRRDVEDQGEWTPIQYYSDGVYASQDAVLVVATRSVVWLMEAIVQSPHLEQLSPPMPN